MKSVTGISWFVLVLFILQACSGIQVSQDYEQSYDFSGFKTFTWKPNNDNEYGISDNRLMDKRIRTAIESTLSAKQYTPVDSGEPDFYISYHMTVEQVISSSNVSGGFSLGRSSHGRYGGVGISSGSQIRTYDQGTLLIDITDVAKNELIWRGISTQAVSEHSSPEESTRVINETVEKMLAQFPP